MFIRAVYGLFSFGKTIIFCQYTFEERTAMYHEKRHYAHGVNFDYCLKENIVSTREIRKYSWHFHDEVEFIYVIHGEVELNLEHKTVTLLKDDIFCIPSCTPHYTIKREPTSYILLNIPIEPFVFNESPTVCNFFSKPHKNYESFHLMLRENRFMQEQLQDLFLRLQHENSLKQIGYTYSMSAIIREILITYLRVMQPSIPSEESETMLESINLALTYIDNNLSENIRVKDLCHASSYSYSYFSKIFKSTMGVSVTDYITAKRIQLAKTLLLTTNLPIYQISVQCGFSGENDIYKKFRRSLGISPLQYRKTNLHNR